MPFIPSSRSEEYGEWFLYGRDPDGKDIRFKVRRLSGGKDAEIELRHQKRSEVFVKKGEARFSQEAKVKQAMDIDKAVYSLLDSENCAVLLPDKEWAEKYSEALDAKFQAGDVVLLDGKWGRCVDHRYPVKEIFLTEESGSGVVARIVERARKLGVQALEEQEAGKDDSSLT